MHTKQHSLPSKEDTNQSRSRPVDPEVKLGEVQIDPNQSRTVGMFKESSDFDSLNQDNPFMTKMESNPEKLHRCVAHVKGKVRNPWAVCNASIKD